MQLPTSTLAVEAVDTFLVDLPTVRPHLLSVATMRAQTLMIVKVLSSDGIAGIGEGTTIGGLSYGAESPEGMKLTIDRYIAPILKTPIRPVSKRRWQRSASRLKVITLPSARSKRRCWMLGVSASDFRFLNWLAVGCATVCR